MRICKWPPGSLTSQTVGESHYQTVAVLQKYSATGPLNEKYVKNRLLSKIIIKSKIVQDSREDVGSEKIDKN